MPANTSVFLGVTTEANFLCGSYVGLSDYDTFTVTCTKPYFGRYVKITGVPIDEIWTYVYTLDLCEVEVYAKIIDGMLSYEGIS